MFIQIQSDSNIKKHLGESIIIIIIIIIIITLFMCQIDLAPCKDKVLIGDTLNNNITNCYCYGVCKSTQR